MSDELAAIVWNPGTKTEHLILRAGFTNVKTSFAFLVPVPSYPQVQKLGQGSTFQFVGQANSRLRTRVNRELWKKELSFPFLKANTAPKGGGGFADPQIFEPSNIGGYDLAIVRASSASALATWLKKNGISSTKNLENWLHPYVRGSWYIVVLKGEFPPRNAWDDSEPGLEIGDLRISFKTDQPTYTYREPIGTHSSPDRLWRCFVFAPRPMVPVTQDGRQGRPKPSTLAALKLNKRELLRLGEAFAIDDFQSGSAWYMSPAMDDSPEPREDQDLTWHETAFLASFDDLAPLTSEGEFQAL